MQRRAHVAGRTSGNPYLQRRAGRAGAERERERDLFIFLRLLVPPVLQLTHSQKGFTRDAPASAERSSKRSSILLLSDTIKLTDFNYKNHYCNTLRCL